MSRGTPRRAGSAVLGAVLIAWVGCLAPGRASAQPAVASPPADARIPAAVEPLPRVRLLATGGTISNRAGGRLTADELLSAIPRLDRFVRPEAEQFSNVASSELTLGQLLQLSRRANALLAADRELAGLVVTTGTDTLEEIAYFLSLTVRDDRPVVVVGSMRNPSTLGYEGAANLLAGFRVAASPEARGLGALVVLNDEINAAREAIKTDALRLHTFSSRAVGVLGVVDRDRVVILRRTVKRAGARSEFDLSGVSALPRVDVILVYQDAPGDLIRAAVDLGARGLVIATAGAGATSGTQGEGLRYARQRGVLVANATRTGGGRIAADTPPAGKPVDDAYALSVAAEDLSPLKARVLLTLALTRTTDRDEIQRMFLEY